MKDISEINNSINESLTNEDFDRYYSLLEERDVKLAIENIHNEAKKYDSIYSMQ